MATKHPGSGRRQVRIAGLVTAKEAYLEEIEAHARGPGPVAEPLFRWRATEDLRHRIAETARHVAELCTAEGSEPADLPSPSRRAYQLLSYLESSQHFEEHVATLRGLRVADQAEALSRVRLDHTGALYRIERGPAGIRLVVSEGFAGAPQEVLLALLRLATPYARKRDPRRIVRDFAESQRYASTLRRVEASGGAYRSRPAGEAHDLRELFEGVNADYFGGELAAPRLLWSERIPTVEFGHYEPATDTIRLSRRLDSPAVPRFVLEHVMHHELLHRVLGAQGGGRRRLYHSARFRREERRFARYEDAEAVLKDLARG